MKNEFKILTAETAKEAELMLAEFADHGWDITGVTRGGTDYNRGLVLVVHRMVSEALVRIRALEDDAFLKGVTYRKNDIVCLFERHFEEEKAMGNLVKFEFLERIEPS